MVCDVKNFLIHAYLMAQSAEALGEKHMVN
jgi:hypothetical protein